MVEESIYEALDFRRAMRKVDEEYGNDWWFKVWGPDIQDEDGIGTADVWVLKGEEKLRRNGKRSPHSWHGFGNLAKGFNMLDPIKATLVTPGLDLNGQFSKEGIPASIVTKFLAEHGVIG